MGIVDEIVNQLLWMPIGLFVAFIVMKYKNFTTRNRPKQRGYYGGEGYLSSFPDEDTDRQRKKRDHSS